MNVFNINNPQDLNNMVWMNNSGNSVVQPTLTTVSNLPQQVLIDGESYYTTAPSNSSVMEEMAQPPTAMMDLNQQLQGTNFIQDFSGIANAGGGIPPELIALQQQQQQLQLQQINLAYGNFINTNIGTIIPQNSEELEEEETENVEYEENNEEDEFSMNQQQNQQQLFYLQQQQHQQQQSQQPPQQLLEQNNIQISDANYFLINNPHLYNSGNLGENLMNSQSPQPRQTQPQLIAPNLNKNQNQQVSIINKKPKESSKILPVRRPGLKLKTPIAYFGNTDPSVIPIQKDGMGVCEKCGAIGVKHAFYTKERRFCSLSCARGFEELAVDNAIKSKRHVSSNHVFKMEQTKLEADEEHSKAILYEDVLPQEPIPQIIKKELPPHYPIEDRTMTIRRKPNEFVNSYDWSEQINREDFFAAPVTAFQHAPGFDVWPDIEVGMKVEVENLDAKDNDHHGHTPFWIATVLKIHGYKAKLRYEGYEADSSHDFWVNLCTAEVHQVGWCASQGRPIIPPLKIEERIKNVKKYLMKTLNQAKTLPGNFYAKLFESFRSRFETNLILEVVDKMCISQVKLARVLKIVGKRLYVQYFDSTSDDSGFWCHEDSPLIHPVGWATTVGHKLSAPADYIERMNIAREQILDPNDDDATMDLFKLNFYYEDYFLDDRVTGFRVGMKLEAIDPLNLSSICVATVMEVLKFGYIMIRIDSYEPDVNGADWFCYHEKSPCIFPVGFCKANGIILTPPRGYTPNTFNWNLYLRDTNSSPATEEIFFKFFLNHEFKVGMKVECADLMDPRLVCVATVSRVVGRLLKIHFDGWEDEYDQWLDCESPDIYPIGWCLTVGHKLEGPKVAATSKPSVVQKNTSPKTNFNKKVYNKKPTKKRNTKEDPKTIIHPPSKNVSQGPSSSQGQIPITLIKKDSDRYTSTIKYVDTPTMQQQHQQHQQNQQNQQYQQVISSNSNTSIKSEIESHSIIRDNSSSNSSNSSSFNNISNFKNLQRNLEMIERQDMIIRQQPRPYEEPEESDGGNELPESHENMNEPPSQLLEDDEDEDDIILSPLEWDVSDVTEFLSKNNCQQYCELFVKHQVDGRKLMQFTQNDIIQLLGMKVGPAIKIYDLIQQVKPLGAGMRNY